MKTTIGDGRAVVLCDGGFATTEGKTAHGLVRHTDRYRVVAVIDGSLAGRDAGEVLDGSPAGIPIVTGLDQAIRAADRRPDYLVVGVATHGGVLPARLRPTIGEAPSRGINVGSGFHEILGDDPQFEVIARKN